MRPTIRHSYVNFFLDSTLDPVAGGVKLEGENHEDILCEREAEEGAMLNKFTRLERERRRREWNQSDLARRAGVHRSAISRVERGLRPPSAEFKHRVGKVLGCSQKRLFGEKSP